MNNSYSVSDMISLYYEKEFASVEKAELPKFSAKYKRQIKKAFRIFDRNHAQSTGIPAFEKTNKRMSFKKRMLLVTALIAFMIFATGNTLAYISDAFHGVIHTDNTQIRVRNTENCPTTIEKIYRLSVLPEGYKLYEVTESFGMVVTTYKNDLGYSLTFVQTIKEYFNSHINTEGYSLCETYINDCNALYVEFDIEPRTEALLIWDNQDYILTLDGVFNKNQLIDLAISNENHGF